MRIANRELRERLALALDQLDTGQPGAARRTIAALLDCAGGGAAPVASLDRLRLTPRLPRREPDRPDPPPSAA